MSPEYTSIYGLVDPRTNDIRYIGKADNPSKRLIRHVWDAQRGTVTHKCSWLRQLLSEGLMPNLIVLEIVPIDDWPIAESRWIKTGRRNGWPLTNLTDGGDGLTGFVFSEASRRKLSEAQRGKTPWNKGKPSPFRGLPGRPHSIETRKKIGDVQRGKKRRPLSVDTRQKIGDSLRGRPSPYRGKTLSPEHCLHMSEAQKSRPLSESQLANLDRLHESNRGHHHSPDHRRKIGIALKGRKFSNEQRQRMSDAKKADWAKRKAKKLGIP